VLKNVVEIVLVMKQRGWLPLLVAWRVGTERFPLQCYFIDLYPIMDTM